jgi:hypothetical protein
MPYFAKDVPSSVVMESVRAFANSRPDVVPCFRRRCKRGGRCRGSFFESGYLPGLYAPMCLIGAHLRLLRARADADEAYHAFAAELVEAAGAEPYDHDLRDESGRVLLRRTP